MDRVFCSGCAANKDEELVLLCDGCNLGMHTYCLDPPLTDIPDGPWFCEGCADAIAAARKACPPSRKRPLLGSPGERPPKASRGAGGPLCVDLQVVGRCERNPNTTRTIPRETRALLPASPPWRQCANAQSIQRRDVRGGRSSTRAA